MRILGIMLLAGSVACAAEPEGGSAQRPAKLGLCVACHGEDGRGRQAGQPDLGGQDRDYLEASLRKYRDGSRRDSVMNAIAGTLSPADIAALSRWYASRGCDCGEAAP